MISGDIDLLFAAIFETHCTPKYCMPSPFPSLHPLPHATLPDPSPRSHRHCPQVDFPFKVSPAEQEIITRQPDPPSSMILLGRSGTGKVSVDKGRARSESSSLLRASPLSPAPSLLPDSRPCCPDPADNLRCLPDLGPVDQRIQGGGQRRRNTQYQHCLCHGIGDAQGSGVQGLQEAASEFEGANFIKRTRPV